VLDLESDGSNPPRAGVPAPGAAVQERADSPPYEGTWRFTAPAVQSSVPQLRHTVRDLIRRQAAIVPEETLHNLLLILSELATNAVQHAAVLSPDIGVEVSLRAGRLRVAVEDDHPYRPKALDFAAEREESTGGRGLLLVKMLAAEAGGVCDVEQTGAGGKVVWAALPVPVTSLRPPP
jgi:two-component sensor histidine kinase